MSISDFETHPLVILEAMAVGSVALVAEISGLPELAEDGLATAVPLGSSWEELARSTRQRLDNPQPTPTARLPTWDNCPLRLLGVYRDAVHGSKPILYRDVALAPRTRP